MALAEKIVKLAELAEALDRSEDWIKRNWLKLHLEKGMPRKMAVGWCWPRSALERWIESAALAPPANDAAPADDATPADDAARAYALAVANQNLALRGRYAGGRA